jgi:hypothetical protein
MAPDIPHGKCCSQAPNTVAASITLINLDCLSQLIKTSSHVQLIFCASLGNTSHALLDRDGAFSMALTTGTFFPRAVADVLYYCRTDTSKCLSSLNSFLRTQEHHLPGKALPRE